MVFCHNNTVAAQFDIPQLPLLLQHRGHGIAV